MNENFVRLLAELLATLQDGTQGADFRQASFALANLKEEIGLVGWQDAVQIASAIRAYDQKHRKGNETP